MNLPFGARRLRLFVPSHLIPAVDPAPEATIPPRNLVAQMASGCLVAHYANRRAACDLQTADLPVEHRPLVRPIGRGSLAHPSVDTHMPAETLSAPARRHDRGTPRAPRSRTAGIRERLVAAGLVATICAAGFAGSAAGQQRYRVQPGDTLAGVAAEFGVDPEAITRSSWFSNPPGLTAGDVIVIPDPGQSPGEAAQAAAASEGAKPWTSGVYWVESGDTIAAIAEELLVDPESLLSINGLTWDVTIYPGDRLLIPGTGEVAETVAQTGEAATASGPVLDALVWVPAHQQERGLSCEYAAASIATGAFGDPLSESTFIDAIPVTNNPHYGFRGNIDGNWGEYDDWGIYAEPLVPVLNATGFAAEAFYSMGDASLLRAHLDAGHPVVVWLAMWGDTGRVYDDEGQYTVYAGSHVMTAYGYDDDGVYLSDPGTASYRFIDWGTFVYLWGTIDGMSLAIYPF